MNEHSQSDRLRFREAYERTDVRPPWDIRGPQPAFERLADSVVGRVLDVGCGTGENALFFASRGHEVTGVDFLDGPLQVARTKAAQRGLAAEFVQRDALTLADWTQTFDTLLDSGLFHAFSDDERLIYAHGLAEVCRDKGRLLLLCFSDQEPGEHGPRRVAAEELRATFADAWYFESLEPARFAVRADSPLEFSPGGPHAWIAVLRRRG